MGDLIACWYIVAYDGSGGEGLKPVGSQEFRGQAGASAEMFLLNLTGNFKFVEGVNRLNFDFSSYIIDESKITCYSNKCC
ncbi:MAG: hypothetical protein LBE57_00410 [Methanosarcinales archaeon]|jgi:hypothetical protein|nr:hypothetical protein [Methanosarcinales archaeon]